METSTWQAWVQISPSTYGSSSQPRAAIPASLSQALHAMPYHVDTGPAYLAGVSLVHQDPRHDDSLIQRVEQPLHEVVLGPLGLACEVLADLLQAPYGLQPQLDEFLGGDDANLGSYQEAQGATGPGYGVEQV